MKATRILATLLVGMALVVGACSSEASSSPAASEAPGSQAPASEAPAGTPPTDPLGVVQIPAGEPIHIGQWGVFSGANASLGQDSNEGIQIAIEDHGGQILGHEIRLTTEDALCSPEGGATAGQKLAADSTLVGLVGATCSDETVGGIKSVTDAGLTTISPSNTRPALTDAGRDASFAGFLRTAHNDLVQGKAAAEFAYNELKVTKAATIHDGSSYAQALQQVFADEFVKLGGTITIQEAVSTGQTDMKPVLTRIAATSPEFIYYPYFVAEGGYTTAQVKEVPGLENVKTMGADGQFTADFVKAAGTAAEGHYLSSPDFTSFGSGYGTLVEKIQTKFGHSPLSIYHAHAYDAATMLFAAIEAVAVQGEDGSLYVPKGALRDALFATKDFQGITGTLTCNATGDCGAPVMAVYQITARETGGQWPPVEPIWRQGQ
ncbi:MAG: branched-chain amino acid ABC transporter substrate-binding protein [Chloroflexi bacterium]|jgi:branched-chain amino acid transport system substrate-binding protein|nr:branched-chain amino acid ABC transporter substrate-binding protein [Chloroflexota bacterium]